MNMWNNNLIAYQPLRSKFTKRLHFVHENIQKPVSISNMKIFLNLECKNYVRVKKIKIQILRGIPKPLAIMRKTFHSKKF